MLHFALLTFYLEQAALVLPQAGRVLETLLHRLVRGLFKWRMQSAECKMPRHMKHQNLQIRTKQFALQVIKFCESLPKDETSRIMVRQLLRSGTSVGANYRAACRSKSKPAFISKMGDVLEEADESGYWIELLVAAGKVEQQTAAPLLAESKELVAIAMSSINTAKRNSELAE